MLVLLDRDWGGRIRPPRQKFSVTSVGVGFNQWGLNPPQPPDKSNAVCVSVTLQYCIKTAKRSMTQIIPHNSTGTLVFDAKDHGEIRPGSPLREHQTQMG